MYRLGRTHGQNEGSGRRERRRRTGCDRPAGARAAPPRAPRAVATYALMTSPGRFPALYLTRANVIIYFCRFLSLINKSIECLLN